MLAKVECDEAGDCFIVAGGESIEGSRELPTMVLGPPVGPGRWALCSQTLPRARISKTMALPIERSTGGGRLGCGRLDSMPGRGPLFDRFLFNGIDGYESGTAKGEPALAAPCLDGGSGEYF